jgi:Zn-dependent protease
MAQRKHQRHLRPDASEARLLEATVGPGRYRVLTRWPLTIAFGPGAYVPALVCAIIAFRVEMDRGLGPAFLAGAIAAVATIFAVAAHEAGHLLFGRHVRGLVPRILLLRGSGGASIVEGRFETARGAAIFAAGGPVATAALTLAYFVIALLAPWHAVSIGLFVPALASAMLLAINLVPVAPTDGYALFRSALWAETGSRKEAERRAIAWSRVVLLFGLIVALELAVHHPLAGVTALFALSTLAVQHHAAWRRVNQD